MKMAKILKDVLADKLYTIPPDWKDFKMLPSPEKLKNKILIKGRAKLSELTFEKKLAPKFETEEGLSSFSASYKPTITREFNEN
jgi:Phosphatidylinositol-specific phospholipase C, X domain